MTGLEQYGRGLAGAALLVLCSACATFVPREPPAASFDLLGRVFVKYEGRAFASNLRWLHGTAGDEIWLMSPLGQTLAHIQSGPGGATATGPDQQSYQSFTLQGLTRRALGWELPLQHLRHWVRGTVAPGAEPGVMERDPAGRLVELEQHGWKVSFFHDPAPEGGGLPRRLELAGEGSQIRLVIDNWREPDPGT